MGRTMATAASKATVQAAELSSSVSTSAALLSTSISEAQDKGTECNKAGRFYNATSGECVPFATMVLGRSAATTCNIPGAIKVNPSTKRIEVCDAKCTLLPTCRCTSKFPHTTVTLGQTMAGSITDGVSCSPTLASEYTPT